MLENNKDKKLKDVIRKLLRSVIIIFTFYLVYLITYGGQYSFYNLYQSSSRNRIARNRNEEQIKENTLLAEENYRIQTDEEKQVELSHELGYMKPGEKIIKRTD